MSVTNNELPQPRTKIADYLKALLGAIASLFAAAALPSFAIAFRATSLEKATGLAVVASGLVQAVFSLWFWILFLVFFSLLYATGRLREKMSRVLFFWVPTLAICALGFALWALMLHVVRTANH